METHASSPDYENKFRECDDRFSAIFQLTTAASKIIDSELTIILQVNRALTDLMGYSNEELTNRIASPSPIKKCSLL
jgi:two-component system CheB/CheR fusion protein